jgi:drug/metabolite transporter (DMT)-like permease
MAKEELAKEEQPIEQRRPRRLVIYGLLHLIFFLYSLSAVCSKMASGYDFLSLGFVGWYGAALCLLGVYALVWQRVLKFLPLTTAFANKGVTIVWGILWGALLFGESFGLSLLIGAALVFTGILLVVTGDE